MAQINESGQIIAGIRNVRADDSVDECGCSQSWLSRGSIFEPFFRVRALNAILSEPAQQETNDPHFYYASGCVLHQFVELTDDGSPPLVRSGSGVHLARQLGAARTGDVRVLADHSIEPPSGGYHRRLVAVLRGGGAAPARVHRTDVRIGCLDQLEGDAHDHIVTASTPSSQAPGRR
jgi:hypothetical protein